MKPCGSIVCFGLREISGVSSSGADLTYASALGMASTADQANIGMGRRAFVTNYFVKCKATQTLLISADCLWMNAGIAGMPTLISNVVRATNSTNATVDDKNTTGSNLFYGNWSDLLINNLAFRILGIKYDENTFTDNVPIDPLKIPSMFVALELALIKKTKLRSPFGSSLFCYATKTTFNC